MEWIEINHRKKGKNNTKPPVGELVILGYRSDKKEPGWSVAGYRDKYSNYWNQFMDKYSDVEIYPTHWMPLPEPPKF